MNGQSLQVFTAYDQHPDVVEAIHVEEGAGSSDADFAEQPVAELGHAVQHVAAVDEAVQLQRDAGAVGRANKAGDRFHARKPATRKRGADTGKDDRTRRLGKIHQGKKALGLSDPEYRALLMRASADDQGIGGIDSSANMTEAQHIAVLREMARLGFKFEAAVARQRKRWPGEPKDCASRPMLGKVRALLADGKKPWGYAHAMAKRMFHVEKVEWLNDGDLHKLIAALEVSSARGNREP